MQFSLSGALPSNATLRLLFDKNRFGIYSRAAKRSVRGRVQLRCIPIGVENQAAACCTFQVAISGHCDPSRSIWRWISRMELLGQAMVMASPEAVRIRISTHRSSRNAANSIAIAQCRVGAAGVCERSIADLPDNNSAQNTAARCRGARIGIYLCVVRGADVCSG